MLIIGRRVGESIFLGEDVEIRIIDLTPSRVKVGIVAPKVITVRRGEVLRAEEQNREASHVTDSSAVAQVLSHLRISPQASLSDTEEC